MEKELLVRVVKWRIGEKEQLHAYPKDPEKDEEYDFEKMPITVISYLE